MNNESSYRIPETLLFRYFILRACSGADVTRILCITLARYAAPGGSFRYEKYNLTYPLYLL